MRNILKEKGHKATPARLAILEIFSKNKAPLDAEIVYKTLVKSKKGKNINEATVYRTLSSLEKSGILKRIDMRKDSVYFELGENHHHHIVCTKCDKVEDFTNKEIEKLIRHIVEKSSKFRKVTEHSLELFGFCVKCA